MTDHNVTAIKILIIDDEEDLRTLMRMWLEQAGYAVFETGDGTQAAAICRSEGCSLVVCDLFMDQKEGIETIRELRREFPPLKVVAISGGGTREMLDMLPIARILGAAETLPKPFDRVELLETIERVLSNQS